MYIHAAVAESFDIAMNVVNGCLTVIVSGVKVSHEIDERRPLFCPRRAQAQAFQIENRHVCTKDL